MTTDLLPPARRVLAIVAHPDDESFGLGGIIAAFVRAGVAVDVLCLTHGEASTLGRQHAQDLGELRATKLAAAGAVLGVDRTELLAWPDGALGDRPVVELAVPIAAMARETYADVLLTFDDSGVTGHPDHRRVSEATRTVANASGMTAFAWAVPEAVATQLNGEFGTTFVGYQPQDLPMAVPVDRDRQRRAIACHASQATDNPVLWRRLELTGSTDHLRPLA
jgi:LmbE family N-acetylglucosaminyl deacetylase